MDRTDDIATLIYNVSFHVIEIGRYIVNFLVSRTWHDAYLEHQEGHVPDPDQCAFCRYERDVVVPKLASAARDSLRARRAQNRSGGFDDVDAIQ